MIDQQFHISIFNSEQRTPQRQGGDQKVMTAVIEGKYPPLVVGISPNGDQRRGFLQLLAIEHPPHLQICTGNGLHPTQLRDPKYVFGIANAG